MSTTRNKKLNNLSENPLKNLPALIRAINKEANEIRERREQGIKTIRQFKDKKGYYKL